MLSLLDILLYNFLKLMSQFFKVAELEKLGLITVYRMLLKNLKHYPSVNRYSIMVAVQDEFRENVNLTA